MWSIMAVAQNPMIATAPHRIPGFNKLCRSVMMGDPPENNTDDEDDASKPPPRETLKTQLLSFRQDPEKHADCDPDVPDKSGRTPVFYASLKVRRPLPG